MALHHAPLVKSFQPKFFSHFRKHRNLLRKSVHNVRLLCENLTSDKSIEHVACHIPPRTCSLKFVNCNKKKIKQKLICCWTRGKNIQSNVPLALTVIKMISIKLILKCHYRSFFISIYFQSTKKLIGTVFIIGQKKVQPMDWIDRVKKLLMEK